MARLVLVVGALGVGMIAVGYMVSPAAMFGLYGIELTSINALNMVRAAYGGILGGLGVLFLLGALRVDLRRAALVAMLASMGGAAVARIVSVAVDGGPSGLVNGLLVIEVVSAVLAAIALRREPA